MTLTDEATQALTQSGSLEAGVSYALTEVFREAAADPHQLDAASRAEQAFAEVWQDLTGPQQERIESAMRPTDAAPKELFNEILRTRSLRASRAARESASSKEFNELIGRIARPAATILDPACGLGGTLAAVESSVTEALVGFDTDPRIAAIARMRLLLNSYPQDAQPVDIRVGSALVAKIEPGWDLIVAHPPLNQSLPQEGVQGDVAEELLGGERGSIDGNAAWIQRVSSLLGPKGQGFVVTSPASLAHRDQIRQVRAGLIEKGLLEAIIALPTGALPETESPSFLWVLSGSRDARKDGRILVLDAHVPPLKDTAAAAKKWLDEASAENLPGWFGRLVSGEELLDKGFAPQIHLDAPPEEDAPRPAAPAHLLNSLTLQNFRSVEGVIDAPLRPLTLVVGRNSAGKSSLIQSLLLLRQSVDAGGFAATGNLADLGSLPGLVHGHDTRRQLGAGFSFGSAANLDSAKALPDPSQLRHFRADFSTSAPEDSVRSIVLGLGEELFEFKRVPAGFTLPASDFKRAVRLVAKTTPIPAADLQAFLAFSESGYPEITFRANGMLVGRLPRQEIFYRSSGAAFSSSTEAVLGSVEDFFGALSDEVDAVLNQLAYLGPLRTAPERFSRHRPSRGGHDTPFFLLENVHERDEVSRALANLGIPYRLETVNPVSEADRDVLGDVASIILTDVRSGVRVTPADVGFGISQVLPIVTELSARSHSLILVEQPEIHLHPAMQAQLADLFIESTDPHRRANQVIAETHSEMLILRIQRRIREQVISPNDVLVLYVDQSAAGEASVRELRLDEQGDFLDSWPGGFFDDQFNELFGTV